MEKILVAYFSASGVTGNKAKLLAKAAGADICKIQPKEPYTAADLNWRNPLSRCNREKFKKIKPEIEDLSANPSDYDAIYLCFPIWYYNAPDIILSFLDKYDFAGKTIYLFATSGGSTFGKTAIKLQTYAGDAKILEGGMLNGIENEADAKRIIENIK